MIWIAVCVRCYQRHASPRPSRLIRGFVCVETAGNGCLFGFLLSVRICPRIGTPTEMPRHWILDKSITVDIPGYIPVFSPGSADLSSRISSFLPSSFGRQPPPALTFTLTLAAAPAACCRSLHTQSGAYVMCVCLVPAAPAAPATPVPVSLPCLH